MIHTDCHTFDPIFSPPYISPKPLFLPKIVTQSHSVTLSKCPEFWKFFTQRPLIGWNLRKRYPNAAYFVMAFVTERPPIFFALHKHVCLRGMLPQTRSEAGKFCILETESSNWGILSGANLIKVMKIKFHFYRLNRPNCALYG